MVLTAYRGFSVEMADIAERFFTDRWIDAPVRPGKAPGAFSHPTTPSAHPYVLMNYQGKPRDVMTLAHELGHGVHQVLAAKNGALMAPTPLTLAETASVFGEMLTFKRLLSQTKNAKQRQAMLAGKVEDMINTVVRQIAFYSFERGIYTERKDGELTADRMGEIWMNVQRDSLGPAIDLRPEYREFLDLHPPLHPFAVLRLPYAFGDCLVNSLYAVYENATKGFAERYLDMLAAGGTKHYSELLKPFGLDANDPKFWHGGLRVISGMIDELEEMGRRGRVRPRNGFVMGADTISAAVARHDDGDDRRGVPHDRHPDATRCTWSGSFRGRLAAHDRWQRGSGPACSDARMPRRRRINIAANRRAVLQAVVA